MAKLLFMGVQERSQPHFGVDEFNAEWMPCRRAFDVVMAHLLSRQVTRLCGV